MSDQNQPERGLLAQELLDQLAQLEREAAQVFPGEHDRCSYIAGFPCDRQRVYACQTCTPAGSGRIAGVCYSCSISCHADHELLELFTKRDFICDCGNAAFAGFKCKLEPDKAASNPSNVYSHNFVNRYCRCDKPYDPNSEDDVMHQCAACEDWFHTRCLFQPPASADAFATFVCARCARNVPTLVQHRFALAGAIQVGYEQPQSQPAHASVAASEEPIDVVSDQEPTASASKRPAEDEQHADQPEAKKLKTSMCLIGGAPAVVGDVDLYLAEDWDKKVCECESCSVLLRIELKDVRQFIETVGRDEFVSNLVEDEEDDEEDETAASTGPSVTAPAAPTAPAPAGEVTSTYELGIAALQTRPYHEQQRMASAISGLVGFFKAEFERLRADGVTEVTAEHIESIKYKMSEQLPPPSSI